MGHSSSVTSSGMKQSSKANHLKSQSQMTVFTQQQAHQHYSN